MGRDPGLRTRGGAPRAEGDGWGLGEQRHDDLVSVTATWALQPRTKPCLALIRRESGSVTDAGGGARDGDGPTRTSFGGRAPRARPPLWPGGRRPVWLWLVGQHVLPAAFSAASVAVCAPYKAGALRLISDVRLPA
jgi:hypothetical protein